MYAGETLGSVNSFESEVEIEQGENKLYCDKGEVSPNIYLYSKEGLFLGVVVLVEWKGHAHWNLLVVLIFVSSIKGYIWDVAGALPGWFVSDLHHLIPCHHLIKPFSSCLSIFPKLSHAYGTYIMIDKFFEAAKAYNVIGYTGLKFMLLFVAKVHTEMALNKLIFIFMVN